MKVSLKAARVNAGLTQKEVADKLEVSKYTIINWEQGKYKIDRRTLIALAFIYNIDIKFLNIK